MVEIIPRQTQKNPLWLDILFYFSIVLVLASVAALPVLILFSQKAVAAKASLEEAISKEKEASEKLEKEVLRYQRKLADFALLVQGYKKPLNFFPVLERITHPEVQFTQLNLSPKDSQAGLTGRAASFAALDQQLSILREASEIKEVQLANLSLAEGGVGFNLILSLDEEIFSK